MEKTAIWLPYLAEHAKSEVVNRIFNIVSILGDDGCMTYAMWLKDALVPLYHEASDREVSSIDNDAAVRFVKSTNQRNVQEHFRNADDMEDD